MKGLFALLFVFATSQAFAAVSSNDVFLKNGGDSADGQLLKGRVDKNNSCFIQISKYGEDKIRIFASIYSQKKINNFSIVLSSDEISNDWKVNELGDYLSYSEPMSFIQYISYDPATLVINDFEGYVQGNKLTTCTVR